MNLKPILIGGTLSFASGIGLGYWLAHSSHIATATEIQRKADEAKGRSDAEAKGAEADRQQAQGLGKLREGADDRVRQLEGIVAQLRARGTRSGRSSLPPLPPLPVVGHEDPGESVSTGISNSSLPNGLEAAKDALIDAQRQDIQALRLEKDKWKETAGQWEKAYHDRCLQGDLDNAAHAAQLQAIKENHVWGRVKDIAFSGSIGFGSGVLVDRFVLKK
jgi:hypothetical protein